jgi:hypothetical protein
MRTATIIIGALVLASVAHAAPQMPKELQGKWCVINSIAHRGDDTILDYCDVDNGEEPIEVTSGYYDLVSDLGCDLLNVSGHGPYQLTFKCGVITTKWSKITKEVWRVINPDTKLELTNHKNDLPERPSLTGKVWR